MVFYQSDCVLGVKKKKNQKFWELLNTGSEQTLIPTNVASGPPIDRGLWRSGDQWNFSSDPFHSVFSGSQNPSCNYFCKYRRITGIHILSNWQTPHHRNSSLPLYSKPAEISILQDFFLTPNQIRLEDLIIGSHSTIMGSVSPLCQLLLLTF